MYIKVTPSGLSLSGVEAVERVVGRTLTGEFLFSVMTQFGNEYFFRYQIDEQGVPGWHMYSPGFGAENPAIEACQRNSHGRLNINYTIEELDDLVTDVDDKEDFFVTMYLLVPGHRDALEKPDFVVFPLNKNVIGFLRAFTSISNQLVEDDIAHSLKQILTDARQFFLERKYKSQFLNDPLSELGMVNTKIISEGFYIFVSKNAPPFIRNSIQHRGVNPEILFLEKSKDYEKEEGMILDFNGNLVGQIKDIQSVLRSYESLTASQKRLNQIENQAINTKYRPAQRDIRRLNQLGKDMRDIYRDKKEDRER